MTSACFDVVVAADEDRGIARRGAIPWHLPADLRHFKRVTTAGSEPGRQNAVIMGRVTWASLPARVRPLPERHNIVVSRDPALALPPGAWRAPDLDRALADVPPDGALALGERFVIGGGRIYAAALARPGCRHIYYTRVLARFGCDLAFPPFEDRFVLSEILAEDEHDGVGFRIEKWTHPHHLTTRSPKA